METDIPQKRGERVRIAGNTTAKIAVAAGIICLLVYLKSLVAGFVNLDDPDFVVNNVAIRQLDGDFLSWAFTTAPFDLWIPLTWLSFALDYRIWGLNPLGYHLTNVFLHAFNTGLVVMLADSLLRQGLGPKLGHEGTSGQACRPYRYPAILLLAGLLWGIHPLRVESVAWVSERKDVLNGLFSLASILCYLRYAQKNEEAGRTGQTRDYLLSLAFFLASLMAKPVSVVIPLMLLVADWFPLGRLRKGNVRPVLMEKIPYLALSLCVSVATIYFGLQNKIMLPFDDLTFGFRVIIAGHAVFEYCRLLLFPVGISPLYVLPNPLPYAYAVKTVAVLVVTCFCFFVGRKFKFLTATWLCFLLPLAPVIGFLQNGTQSHAARYTYLPSIVPSIVAAAMLVVLYTKGAEASHRWQSVLVAALTAGVLVFHGAMTVRLVGSWSDSGALWSRVIALHPVGRAYLYRGMYYVDAEDYPAAIADYTRAIEISHRLRLPESYNLYAFRGEALAKAGRYGEAVDDFTIAIESYPHPRYFYNRGVALKALGKVREAGEDFMVAGAESGPIRWYGLP